MYKFPKEKKLLKARDFKQVLGAGNKFVLPEVVLFSRKNEFETSRMGLIVTKKIGNAVVRNKIKRRLREIFRQTKHHKEQNQVNLDLVFIARPKVKTVSYEKLDQSFEFALKHLVRRHRSSQEAKK